MEKKTLYRLIWGHDFKKGETCIPEVPSCHPGEDQNTPRICVTETIAGGLTALGAANIGEMAFGETEIASEDVASFAFTDIVKAWILMLYPVTILEFDVVTGDPMVMVTEQLSVVDFDAAICGKHWILEERKPDRVRKVWLRSAAVTAKDCVLSNGLPVRYYFFSNEKWSARKAKPDFYLTMALFDAYMDAVQQKNENEQPKTPSEQSQNEEQ